MTFISILLSLASVINSYHFIINPMNLVPNANDEIRLEIDTKLKPSELSKYSFYARSDKNQISSDKSDLLEEISIKATGLKDSDFLYLQIENNKTKEKYYTNKVHVYSRSVYKKYLDKLRPTVSTSPVPVSEIEKESTQTSDTPQVDLSPYIKRFEAIDRGTLYAGLVLIAFAAVGAVAVWYFFRGG